MGKGKFKQAGALLIALASLWHFPAFAVVEMTPLVMETNHTWHSIGIRWNITGDDNHNASGQILYGENANSLQPAFGLVRVDGIGGNYLAGSILFLQPNTSYTIQVQINDPDGGSDSSQIVITTKPVPVASDNGKVVHVQPGQGGGTGTLSDPYLGLETAWAVASPGQTLLLHAGHYGAIDDTNGTSGQPGARITIKAAGDGAVTLDYLQLMTKSHIWIEGLTFIHNASAGSDTGLFSSYLNPGYDNGFVAMNTDIVDIVVARNTFTGYKHSIRAGPRTRDWVVVDNTIQGDKQLGGNDTASFDGEGVELGHGDHHIVAYNSITRVADAISFPGENCDIFSNDIFDVTDDGVELDGGGANTRAWYNRIHNAGHNGFSFQPQYSGPWYLVRNQVINYQESAIKFRETDRLVVIHNTFINWDNVLDHWAGHLLRGIVRNNLWISTNNGRIWNRSDNLPDWRADFAYNGFDWGSNSQAFDVGGTKYSDIQSLQIDTGLELNSIKIDHTTCFEVFNLPGPAPFTTVPPQWITPASDCGAVDAGEILAGFNEDFTGIKPDLGIIERGKTPPPVGPRANINPGGGNNGGGGSGGGIDPNPNNNVGDKSGALGPLGLWVLLFYGLLRIKNQT